MAARRTTSTTPPTAKVSTARTAAPETSSTTSSPFFIESEEDIEDVVGFEDLEFIEGFATLITPLPKNIKLQISDIDSTSGLISFDYKGEIGSDYASNNELCFLSDRVFQGFEGGNIEPTSGGPDSLDRSLFYVGDATALPTDFGENSTEIQYTKFYRDHYSDEADPIDSQFLTHRNTKYIAVLDRIYDSLRTLVDPEITIQERTEQDVSNYDIKNPDTLFSKFVRFDKL
jgi:hypothetical protein